MGFSNPAQRFFTNIYYNSNELKRKFLLFIYIIMKDGSKESYLKTLKFRRKYIIIQSKLNIIDFEIAAFAVLKEKFSNVNVCFLHSHKYCLKRNKNQI